MFWSLLDPMLTVYVKDIIKQLKESQFNVESNVLCSKKLLAFVCGNSKMY